jgi:hypothetical protein
MKLMWSPISTNGQDVQAETEIGTYTISIDAPFTGGMVYLWLPDTPIHEPLEFEYKHEAVDEAVKHFTQRGVK